MLGGAIPLAICFCLQWLVPPTTDQWLLFAYYSGIAFLFYIAFTAVAVPYSTLAAELTQGYDERTGLVSFKAAENGSGLSQICNAQGEELRRRLRFLFRAGYTLQAAANQPLLRVTKDAQVAGVAVIQEPESCFPLWTQIQWLLQVSVGVSPFVAWRLWQNMRILERHHPPEPHSYLVFLGVHPHSQS